MAVDRRAEFNRANRDPARVGERQDLRDRAARYQHAATATGIAAALAAGLALFFYTRD
jgi:hypothetical protein